ncbi:cellulose synthase-like protein D2 [Wolffia australiana]
MAMKISRSQRQAGAYTRKSNSGRYVSYTPEPGGGETTDGGDYARYLVEIPATPDNHPIAAAVAQTEEQYVSSSIFSGGFNSATRAHLMEKVTDSDQNKATAVGRCAVAGCDGRAMRDERGQPAVPCECGFSICADCYAEAARGEGETGVCPGCKEPYVAAEDGAAPPGSAEKLTMVRSGVYARSQTGEFDQNRWLFETRGTYGYGNALWPSENDGGDGGDGGANGHSDLMKKTSRPLTRKLKISAAILSPYRLLIFVRMVVLGLFLAWRIRHVNEDAVWLWGMSVVCEIWFAFSWLLDQLPKLCPVNRAADLAMLKEKFDSTVPSSLPGIDVFVSTADPEKEPPLVTANTILSILAADYPVDKLSCYVSDDGGSLLTFEAMAEAASFASLWVPFCRKHAIEPRNPDAYFSLKRDPFKTQLRPDFVRDRRRVKREYDEFKVRINALPDAIRRRSDAFNAREEVKALRRQRESGLDPPEPPVKLPKATWMADGSHWPAYWSTPSPDHAKSDHPGVIQVMLKPPSASAPLSSDPDSVDDRLPALVYVSREKRPGYDHNKKAGAMNALVRASAVMSNGAFILNLDCDHYVYNSKALREGICYMLDAGGDRLCYVQFPQRFEGIDPSDRYANRNSVFFDVNMRALDGLQGPVYVGTGCLFRRVAVYGFDPPKKKKPRAGGEETAALIAGDWDLSSFPKRFGGSSLLSDAVAELAEPGARRRRALDSAAVAEAVAVVSSWYEEKTEWGGRVGWIYGSVTEDVVTGYRMHNRGWRSVYCVTKPDAFRGTAPINLTDRLHQVLRWATGSVEIFFSRNNAVFASRRMKLLQRIAYLNVGIYPFTSVFLVVYCFLPALSLFSGEFIVQSLNVTFLAYLLGITLTLCLLAVLEIRWSGVSLEEWWRNEQFWLIGGTSAHLAAVFQGLLKVIAGVDISFTLTSKASGEDADDEFAELYAVKWTALMIMPLTIIMVNLIAIAVGVSRTIYSVLPQWSRLIGGVFFSVWVLLHLYPFAKGLMGRRGRTPTVVFVWAGLIAITISLLWVAISPPSSNSRLGGQIGGTFTFP